MKMKLKQ